MKPTVGSLFTGVEAGSNVFLKYANNEFTYVVGDFLDTPHRYKLIPGMDQSTRIVLTISLKS